MSKSPPVSLARRLLPAVAMTTAASGLVALLDQPSSGAAIDLGDNASVQPTLDDVAVVATDPPVVSSTQPAVVQQPTASSVVPLVPVTTQQPVATTTIAVASDGTCAGQTIDGATVDTRWGPVQVEAVVSATGQICDVDAIQSPDAHRKSVRINDQALPILHTQVMTAQSADINGVSGATITSSGYARSLQSILDSVG
jgi:uncharacterized protein with FMN-binding domain